ncbi:MAG: hypothetical protein LC437_09900 [Thiohalomonas sp.]|nr:hypothetical protein [Thiohalomonas sp.]
MDTLTVIIIGVVILLIFDVFLIHHVRKKRKGSFKLVIENGVITENKGNVPSEFYMIFNNWHESITLTVLSLMAVV